MVTKLSKERRWYYTRSGKKALAWLLGFYDGDGHYAGGGSAILSSSSIEFLNQIKENFMIRNPVRVYDKSNSISLGPKLFKALLWSYSDSMHRKRPLNK